MERHESKATKTRLANIPLLGFFLSTIPSISDSPRRWAFFQVMLAIEFFSIAAGIALFTVDWDNVGGIIMVIAFFLLGMGFLGLIYTIGLGMYWFRDTKPMNPEADRLHDDIRNTIQSMEACIRQIEKQTNIMAELVRKMGNK